MKIYISTYLNPSRLRRMGADEEFAEKVISNYSEKDEFLLPHKILEPYPSDMELVLRIAMIQAADLVVLPDNYYNFYRGQFDHECACILKKEVTQLHEKTRLHEK